MGPENMSRLPWSSWMDAESIGDGVGRVRRELGQELSFHGSLERAVAYADSASEIAVAEVHDFGSVREPQWRYRIRVLP
jgi:hypothetical protein